MIRAICGNTGIGKTMTNAIIAINEMLDEERYESCCAEIDLLNYTFGRNFRKPRQKHCVFSTFIIKDNCRGGQGRTSYPFNPFMFALPNTDFDYSIFPPYSCFHGQEAQAFLNSRKSNLFPDSVSRAYENHRHPYYDITLDGQRLNLFDVNVRDIINEFWFPIGAAHEYNHCKALVKTTAYCLVFYDNETAAKYTQCKDKSLGEVRTLEFFGDIFSCYDSHSNKNAYFDVPKSKDFEYLDWEQVTKSFLLPPAGYYNRGGEKSNETIIHYEEFTEVPTW